MRVIRYIFFFSDFCKMALILQYINDINVFMDKHGGELNLNKKINNKN